MREASGEGAMHMEKKDVLDDVFDKFLGGKQIFKDREALRPDYIPSYLPHREEQIQQIGGIVAPILKSSRGSNIFIYGQTGTGKTAVVKYVLDRLLRKSEEIGTKLTLCYVNCRLTGTDYRILAGMCSSLSVDIPFTGLATSEVFDRFKADLEAQQTLMVAVLDEVDALVTRYGDALLYDLTRVNESLKHSKISVIGISNDLRFKEFLDPRVLSSLSEEEVVFRPYSAPELTDILLERSKLSFVDDVLSDGALKLTAALAAAEHGDARRALDLLRVAGEIAERGGNPAITENDVREAQKKIEHDRIYAFLRSLPLHSKLIMCSVYLMRKTDAEGTVTGDVYEVYRELCGQAGVGELTQRRISGLISELEINGILECKIVSLGRYGRTKKIRLDVPMSVLKNVYSDDAWTAQLMSYAPNCLKKKNKEP